MSQAQAQAQAQAAYEENLRKALPDVSGNVWSDLIINELCYEDEVSDAILALLILKQFEQSTTGSSQEESTEDSQTQPTPDPRRDILSRKRARSPSRDLTPCPGLNREPMIAHARKRLCTQNFVPSTTALRTETTSTNTPATTPSSSNNARRVLFGVSAPPVAPPMQPIAPVNVPTTTRLPQPLHFNHPIRRGYRPDPICMKAMMDVKARMTGHATEAHISSVCKKFMVFPKLPAAYLAVCDDSKLELFWLFAGDMGPLQHRVLENCDPPRNLYEKGILKLRMGSRAAPLQHNSVLQTQHMKEIDARPRPSLPDRVKMWLANVTCP